MRPALDEQELTVYASNAQTIQEPYGSDYSQGVRVGKTIPAKWWNWLFNAVTARLVKAFNDVTDIFTEIKNFIQNAGITLSASDDGQAVQALTVYADSSITEYVTESYDIWDKNIKFFHGGVEVFTNNRTIYSVCGTPAKAFSVMNFSGNLKQLIYTEDGEYWHEARLTGYSFGVVYKNGLFYVLAINQRYDDTGVLGTYISTMSLKVTTDFMHYTEILYLEADLGRHSDTPIPVPLLVEAGEEVYLVDAYDDNTYAISGTTATVAQGLVNAKCLVGATSSYERWISCVAVNLSTGRYLAKNLMLNNGTWSVLFNETALSDIYGFVLNVLSDGVIANETNAYNGIYAVASDGTVTQLSVVGLSVSSLYDSVDCLAVRTSSVFPSVTYGDGNLIQLPQGVYYFIKSGDYYYLLWNGGLTDNSKIYFKHGGRLTSNINDYTLLRELDSRYTKMYRIRKDSSLIYVALYKAEEDKFYATKDFGINLSVMRYTDGTLVTDNSFYNRQVVFDRMYLNDMCTGTSRRNRVSGGTLYLQ